ncbi:hypothetical protein YC2023_084894 [Brassica napus]
MKKLIEKHNNLSSSPFLDFRFQIKITQRTREATIACVAATEDEFNQIGRAKRERSVVHVLVEVRVVMLLCQA